MALPTVTYKDYQAYGGTLSEEAFNASIAAAQAWVRYILGFNSPTTDEENDACIRAICAAVNVDAAYGASGGIGESVSSITVGSFSMSSNASGDPGTSSYQIDVERVIRQELTGTRLLFQGIN